MNCEEIQALLHDFHRKRLDDGLEAQVTSHLEACTACSGAEQAERALDELLERRLPRHAAPDALKRRLDSLVSTRQPTVPPARRRSPTRWARYAAPALAAGVALVIGGVLTQRSASESTTVATLTGELVNDHLRVLASQRPVEIESGGQHQVKPWFEGKLDFAPEVPMLEGSELALRGGSVGYVFDRKAAVLLYALRRHQVTLLVFRGEGLALPDASAGPGGPVRVRETSARGFNVAIWRSGELAYALVSDVNPRELGELGQRLAAAVKGP